MNVLRIFLATPLALISLFVAIPLAFVLLVVLVITSPIVRFLIKDVCSLSKEYKVYEVILNPFTNCFEKIIGYLYLL